MKTIPSRLRHGLPGVLLAIFIVLSLIPHLVKIPFIFSGFIILVAGWFMLHSIKGVLLPNKVIRLILLITALLLIILFFGFSFSQRMSITLLAVMMCLKLMEIKSVDDRRNIAVIIFVSLFLIGSHFLFSQSIYIMLYNIVLLIAFMTILMLYIRKPLAAPAFKNMLREPLTILVQALPLAVVFFLFFPRISEPLWSLPDDDAGSQTGLSDTVYPGRITRLSDNNEVAFRVFFHGRVPASNNLYWRGPVLSYTDGYIWSRYSDEDIKLNTKNIVYNSGKVEYTLTLEPHQQRWLFALDIPATVPADSFFSHDYQLLMEKNLLQVKRYTLTSYTNYTFSGLSTIERQRNLAIPEDANPRTRQMGISWRNKLDNPQAIVNKALDYFNQQAFYYTRKPPVMLDESIDQFLFEFREGFCEHYATAFVYLMRAAGIPARLVTGYQGIEKNEVGNYYMVRQSDAHAWAEVWLESKGWTRVDPTAAISPERIRADILNRQARQLAFKNLNLPKLAGYNQHFLKDSLTYMSDNIDNMIYFWNQWVVGFDSLKQKSIMQLLGLSSELKYLVSMMIGLGLFIIILLSVYWFMLARRIKDPVKREYQRLLARLEKSGLNLQANSGPLEIQALAIQRFPSQKENIVDAISCYINLQYARNSEGLSPKIFLRKVRQLKFNRLNL